MKVEVPFLDEISRLSINKLLVLDRYDTLAIEVIFVRNRALLEVINDSNEVIDLDPKKSSSNFTCQIIMIIKFSQELYNCSFMI